MDGIILPGKRGKLNVIAKYFAGHSAYAPTLYYAGIAETYNFLGTLNEILRYKMLLKSAQKEPASLEATL